MTIMGIIALVLDLAPKLIGAGKSIKEIWDAAGEAIGGAGPDGSVDEEAAAKVRAMVEEQLAELRRNAEEAKA